MPRLTFEARMIISNNQNLSLRKLQHLLVEKTDIKYSPQGIANYKKTLPTLSNLTVSKKVDTPLEKLDTGTPKAQKKKTNGESKKIPPKDNSKLIMDYSRVVNCIHVNINPVQRETLMDICGGYKVARVRKYLSDTLLIALGIAPKTNLTEEQ
ncbi:hypothetical protein CEE45_01670 [Candidatus Heimdallarchaeota archaeon B3_Heim]|nr:MAG: hypothetical protein CEE45_01670 [Candidatus Heimdallarchaeota archaeon B3_Heim]